MLLMIKERIEWVDMMEVLDKEHQKEVEARKELSKESGQKVSWIHPSLFFSLCLLHVIQNFGSFNSMEMHTNA